MRLRSAPTLESEVLLQRVVRSGNGKPPSWQKKLGQGTLKSNYEDKYLGRATRLILRQLDFR